MRKFYDVYEDDGTAVVSFYPNYVTLEKLGFKDVHDMSDTLKQQVERNYPGLTKKEFAQFDPESAGFMVYCATEEIAQIINEELNEMVDSGLQDDIKNRIKSLEEEIDRLKKLLK